MRKKLDNLVQLDPISEAHLYFGHPNFTDTSYMTLTLKGTFNKEIFKDTYYEFLERYPIFNSVLVEKRTGLFYKLYRKPVDSIYEVKEVSLLDPHIPNREKITKYFSKRVLTDFDLFNEVPFLPYICDLGNSHHALVFVSHHVLSDGHGVATFLMKFFLIYYEKLYNKTISIDGILGLFSSRKKGSQEKLSRLTILKILLSNMGIVIKLFFLNRAKTFKLKYPKRNDRYVEKMIFEKEIQEKLRIIARSKDSTVNDLLIAILFRALDTMFEGNRKDKKLFTISAPVNIFGKLPIDDDRANHITSLVYGSYATHREDLDLLLKLIKISRIRQINADIDVVQFHFLQLLVKFTHLFPYRLRVRLFKNVFQQPSTSMLSNLGILWPELKKGRPTGRSMVVKVAKDLEIADIDFNYPGVPSVGHGLASYTFRERLFLILTFNGAFFTRDDVSQILNAIQTEVDIIIQQLE